nr:LysR family transcriptional regulator [Acinetobacter sp. Marseille-Q1620]
MNTIHNKATINLSVFHKIDINLYPLFIAIFEQQSISRAAQILSITQSAASHALQRLRAHLNDDLFVRAGSKMLPTPFAEQIYQPIKQALYSIQSISIQKNKFDPSMVQTIKIAVHDEIEPIIFPKLIHHFQDLNLEIQYLSSKLDRKNIVAELASQQIDFVIDLEQNVSEKLVFNRLVQDYFVFCTQQKNLNPKKYYHSPHIGVSSRRTGILLEDLYLSKKDVSRQIFLRCQHYSTAIQVLEQNDQAILTIPKQILSHLHLPKNIQTYELPVKKQYINLGMYWHRDLQENARHKFLRSEIEKIFA